MALQGNTILTLSRDKDFKHIIKKIEKQISLSLTHINNATTRYSVLSTDISKYMIANTKNILDTNGNVILPTNCSLADLGLS